MSPFAIAFEAAVRAALTFFSGRPSPTAIAKVGQTVLDATKMTPKR